MKKTLLTGLIVLWFLTGCAAAKPVASANDECIPPLYNIAYPSVTHSPNDTPRQILPKGNWQPQSDFPFSRNNVGYLGMRLKQHELWITVSESNKVYRYFINAKQWKSYQTIDSMPTAPNILFMASDGAVWGIGVKSPDKINPQKTRPLLSRFNDATDQFEFIQDKVGLLEAPHARVVSNIVEDQSGFLWFFIQIDVKNILYSFDTKTQRAQEQNYSMIRGSGTNLAVGPDGSIWFLNRFENHIVQYMPTSKKTHTYTGYPESADIGGSLFDLDKVGYIYFDHSEKLWLANQGWLDFSKNKFPVWNQIIESPVFITKGVIPENEYAFSNQTFTYQSSDGLYWFSGANGIVRLDLQKESWCLMTTGQSEVVEDADHNLWIAVFGHLYKYPLAQ